MKVRINGYEVEGTPEEIRQLIGAPQTNPYLAPYVQPWQPWTPNVPATPYYPPYIVYGTSTTGVTYSTGACAATSNPVEVFALN